jgi:signal peptidase I
MSRTNPDRAKNPQFAAILSSLLPGLGHFYNNRPIVGLIWLIVIWGLAGAALWAAIAPGIPLIVGIGLFFSSWILAIVQLFHTHRSVWRANNLAFEADDQSPKDPWLTVVRSRIKLELKELHKLHWGIWLLYFIIFDHFISKGIIGFLLYSWLMGFFIVYYCFYGVCIQALTHRLSGQRKLIGIWLTAFAPTIVGILLALSVTTFVAEQQSILSDQMLPTLQKDDQIIINKLAYHFTPPKRGDLISGPTESHKQQGWTFALIGRIIGIPGETIEVKNGNVFINGEILPETYIKEARPASTFSSNSPDPETNLGPTKVPAGEYFVLGDNRADNFYPRHWGFVPRANIVGQATKRLWPDDLIGVLK